MRFSTKTRSLSILSATLICAAVFTFAFALAQSSDGFISDSQDDIASQIVVLYRETPAETLCASIGLSDGAVHAEPLSDELAVIQVEEPSQVDEVLELLKDDPNVLAADRNCYLEMYALPNDPLITSGSAWQFSKIGAELTWDRINNTGSPVIIGVIDSGLYTAHADMQGRIAAGYDFVDGNAYVVDLVGHGTMVSGCAAAITNNAQGIAGISGTADVRIAPFRVGGSSPSDTLLSLDKILDAILQIADHRPDIKIVNMSFGIPTQYDSLRLAVKKLTDSGRIVVAAAGNDSNSMPNYPASYDGVISVGATTYTDDIAYYSVHNKYVDISAPGSNIVSTTLYNPTELNNAYAYDSGTSFSAPIISACAAVLLAKDPSLTPIQVENALRVTSLDLGAPGQDDYFGAGRVRLDRALQYDFSTGSLTIRNQTLGRDADASRAFTFRFSVTAAGSYSYSGSYSGLIAHDGLISLKSGEYITITQLPTQAVYAVTELEADGEGYVTTVTGGSGSIVSGSSIASFTNKKGELVTSSPAPSGDNASSGKVYSVMTDGTGVVWHTDESVDFNIDGASASAFLSISIDGVPLKQENAFELSSGVGGLTLTLKPSFTSSLKPGMHTVRIQFSDGFLYTTLSVDALEMFSVPNVPATGDGVWVLSSVLLFICPIPLLIRRKISR